MQHKNLFDHNKFGDSINYNVLVCKQQYSEKKIAIKVEEIESIEEWNTDSLCIYMRSGTRLYVEGSLSNIFKDIKND
jgi:CobQ-like glutamine amidotransferase family enzyme